ncbi:MAG: sugar ABC transporter permease [Rhodobacteraceae bacterium]|jgi:ABC-type sugar transport system permease subunit|nr:sugar ABC transporter permease [Paracoccaceae bacterium]MDA0852176.1 sugar ABC transporter permease [Pseudomonadota bacterium]MDA1294997.1 sugar ABC transporter permease [Pseudomonadota bacterium]NCW16812.1 sugar ABC transporter permease [Paracoccaceae bacterium]NCW53427.1 sugar ABC transporter permease [Paracoccaceae bacterium]
MRHSTFFWFFLPTALAMLLFIAFPIVSVVMQSVFAPHPAVLVEVETCTPLSGCQRETTIDQEATRALREAEPLGRFVGLDIFTDRGHLATSEIKEIWANSSTWNEVFQRLGNLPFYRAMMFTLVFTFIVTPFVILLGLLIALTVNALNARLKGLVIFFSLLPFVITPLIGALVLFWMIDSRGVLGSSIQWIFSDPNLSLKASTGLMWFSLILYGVWHAAPFAFVIFYAGLQTLPKDQIEAAQIDGATRLQQVRYVVVPHLMPLVTFVALIQLMDNFRVFEPIVGFNAAAHAQSLSWFIFNDLGGETRQLSSASASSVLTIIGVAILLSPVLVRTWRDFKGKA